MYRAISLVLCGITLFASATSFAAEHKAGTFGLGWYSTSAPVGGRVWLTPQVGLDLGLGYADKNSLGSSNDRFHFNVGLPFDVVQTEHVNFFIRPGYEFQSNSRKVNDELKSTSIVTADLGVEWFVTDQFSLIAGHGIQISQVDGSDNWGVQALRALSFENVGFHFYFK